MSTRWCYVNGHFLLESEAKVSIYDSWAMYGDCVFEMTRSFNGVHFKFEEHFNRLAASCKALRIPFNYPGPAFRSICDKLTALNHHGPGEEHRLMINVSRGPLGIYSGVEGLHHGPTCIISDFPLSWTTRGLGALFDMGVHAVTPAQRQCTTIDPKLKHRSRIHFATANQEVSLLGDPTAWAVLLDADGFLTEGTGANFFIVKDRRIYTSEPRNVLRGISRQYVMTHRCVWERNLEPYDVMTADEAFFTATPFCMLPVTKFNGQPIGDGKVGPVYSEFLRVWSSLVGVDIKAQIQAWDLAGVEAGSSPYKA